ncbi:unnamed protein product [Acanthoscelides obtectus]|uniref:AGRL2-4 GAIN subdomain A domain-containing protein n=1 Tax=Acanthoscelides obtectus TaxID=200917 RepID=A0A9P0KJB8_ACAOB|nr:unnamed protein product [Acanthoscelides obtectus]CAK1655832.1 Protocadherin-like wing polarity protein stan [Acanthoscelides obtectus]
MELREQLGNIKRGQLQVTTFVAVKLASDLKKAATDPKLAGRLYGADVLVTFELLRNLVDYERSRRGLDLSHSQDKDYVGDAVQSTSVVLHEMYAGHWIRVRELTGEGPEDLVADIYRYLQVLAESQRDTYTTPFEIVAPDMVLGLDIVTPESVYGWEPAHLPPLYPGHSYSTESVILPDTSLFLEHNSNESPTISQHSSENPSIVFPKYNNYLLNASKDKRAGYRRSVDNTELVS